MNLKEKPSVQKYAKLNIEIGLRIKTAREKAGLKQHELAELIDVCPQTISAMECGRYRPKYENLIKLCEALHVSCDYIIMGRTEAFPADSPLRRLGLMPVKDQLSVVESVTRVYDALRYL